MKKTKSVFLLLFVLWIPIQAFANLEEALNNYSKIHHDIGLLRGLVSTIKNVPVYDYTKNIYWKSLKSDSQDWVAFQRYKDCNTFVTHLIATLREDSKFFQSSEIQEDMKTLITSLEVSVGTVPPGPGHLEYWASHFSHLVASVNGANYSFQQLLKRIESTHERNRSEVLQFIQSSQLTAPEIFTSELSAEVERLGLSLETRKLEIAKAEKELSESQEKLKKCQDQFDAMTLQCKALSETIQTKTDTLKTVYQTAYQEALSELRKKKPEFPFSQSTLTIPNLELMPKDMGYSFLLSVRELLEKQLVHLPGKNSIPGKLLKFSIIIDRFYQEGPWARQKPYVDFTFQFHSQQDIDPIRFQVEHLRLTAAGAIKESSDKRRLSSYDYFLQQIKENADAAYQRTEQMSTFHQSTKEHAEKIASDRYQGHAESLQKQLAEAVDDADVDLLMLDSTKDEAETALLGSSARK